MRVLLVTHDSLPRHVAGTEIHVQRLAEALISRGVDARVWTSELRHDARPGEVLRWQQGRVAVAARARAHRLRDPATTWRDPEAEGAFATELRGLRPDVVHVHHLQHHGFGLPALARAGGARVLWTLHDFHADCAHPLGGQRFDAEALRCDRVEVERCARCLSRVGWAPPAAPPAPVAAALGALERLRPGSVERLRRGGAGSVGRLLAARHGGRVCAEAVHERLRAARSAVRAVHRFIAPSRFIAARLLAEHGGLPAERVVVLPHATPDARWRERRPRSRGAPLRVGYVGTLAEHKGVLDLVQAVVGLPAAPGVELRVHGDPRTFPAYARRLRRAAGGDPRVRFAGPFAPDAAAEVYAALDVLVVPSRWFENAPLTVLEARRHGVVPVVVALGGLPELVRDGVDGLCLPPGDIGALRGALARLAASPALLDGLRAAAPVPPGMDDYAARVLALYDGALYEGAPRTAALGEAAP